MTRSIVDVFVGVPGGDDAPVFYFPEPILCYSGNFDSGNIWVQYQDNTGAGFTSKLDLSAVSHLIDNPWDNGGLPSLVDASNNCLRITTSPTRIYRLINTTSPPPDYISVAEKLHSLALDSSGNLWARQTNAFSGDTQTGRVLKITSINYSAHTCTETAATGSAFWEFLRDAGRISGRVYGVTFTFVSGTSGTIQGIGYVNTGTGAITNVISTFYATSNDYANANAYPPVVGQDGNIYVAYPADGANAALKKYSADGTLLGSLAMPVAAAQTLKVFLYDDTGKVWCIGQEGSSFDTFGDWQVVNAATMALDSTVPSIGYSHIIGEYASGNPIFYGYDTSPDHLGIGNQLGKIGILGPVSAGGGSDMRVVLAKPRRRRSRSSTRLGKPYGGFIGPIGPSSPTVPRALLALHLNKKWFFASQGDNLTLVAGGFQGGTPALFGTDGTNFWRLFSDPNIEIRTRIQTALWPMKKPTSMKEAQKAGVEITTMAVPTSVTLTLDSDFGSIPATFFASNGLVWLNQVGNPIPWVNNVGTIIQWAASGLLIFQGDAEFKGRYLGYTMTSTSPGFAVNGFLNGYQLSTPWATKAQ